MDNISENVEDIVKDEPEKVVKTRGRPKVTRNYDDIRLLDHQMRYENHTQGVYVRRLFHEHFPDPELRKQEITRIRTEQREKNRMFDKMIKAKEAINRIEGGVAGMAVPMELPMPVRVREAKFPDVRYAESVDIRLDPNTGNTMLLVASSKAGKTTIMMKIYEKYYEKYISILFAHNPQIAEYNVKNLVKTDEFLPRIIEVMRQVAKVNKNKFNFLCMFDDMLSLKTEGNVTDLFLSLRNSNISSIISLQYLNLMSKACRGNVNNILAGSHNSDENILVLIKCYLFSWMKKMGVTNEADMILYYRRLTADHGFIYIHPSSNTVEFVRMKV